MPAPLSADQTPLSDALERWPTANEDGAFVAQNRQALTLWLRWGGTEPLPLGEVVQWSTLKGKPVVRIFCAQPAHRRTLEVVVAMDAREQPLRVSLPVTVLEFASRHDLVLRYAGPRLELFLDGVLVDEEWPLGSLLKMEGAMVVREELRAQIAQIARWDRALSDDEIMLLADGRDSRGEREERILGAHVPVGQFWQPRGLNVHVGDCMPFFHAGRFHFFYLLDRRNHQGKWGLGGHQWAHASTTDLVNWEHHPIAIGITDESEGSICTGSVFFHEGVYHAFYAVRMADGSAAPLCVATSADCIHFTKQPPFAYLTAPYLGQPTRDPAVFRDETTGLFHLLATTSLAKPSSSERAGCLAHLVSRDLRHWEQQRPFLSAEYPGEPECPDHFEWRGWSYLLFSHQGLTHYRRSRAPMGPWEKPTPDIFEGPECRVMKTAAFTGDRRIGAAFVPRTRGVYAGRVIFREIIQCADGTLTTQWPPEMKPEAVGP